MGQSGSLLSLQARKGPVPGAHYLLEAYAGDLGGYSPCGRAETAWLDAESSQLLSCDLPATTLFGDALTYYSYCAVIGEGAEGRPCCFGAL